MVTLQNRVAVKVPLPVAALADLLGDCPNLTGEWSLKLTRSDWQVRDKYVCWLNAAGGGAGNWLDKLRALLPPDSLIGCFDPSEILNLGLGIGCSDQPIYIHGRFNGRLSYLADVSGYRRVYRFHHFPFTPDGDPPERFVPASLRPYFDKLKGDAVLQAIGGFWFRYQHGGVDQVSLSFMDRPPVSRFSDVLAGYSTAYLDRWREHRVKHVAFNSGGDVTFYFSGKMERFPGDFETLQQMVQGGADRSQRLVSSFVDRCTFSIPNFCEIDPLEQEHTASIDQSQAERSTASEIVSRLAGGHAIRDVCIIGRDPGEMTWFADRLPTRTVTAIYATDPASFFELAPRHPLVRLFDPENSLPSGLFDAAIILSDTPMTSRLMANVKPFCKVIHGVRDRGAASLRSGGNPPWR